MIWDSKDQELRVRLAARMLALEIEPNHFDKLCKWLGCYNYIVPKERCIVQGLLNSQAFLNVSDFFRTYLAFNSIEVALTYTEQVNLWLLINESSI